MTKVGKIVLLPLPRGGRRGEAWAWGSGGRTVADPVAGAGEPLGVARGVGVDEEARLLAAVAQGAEGVVAVAAAAAVPVALPAPAAARPARRGSRAGHRSARARGSRRRWG